MNQSAPTRQLASSLHSPQPDTRTANRNPPSRSPHRQVRKFLAHIKSAHHIVAAPAQQQSTLAEGSGSGRQQALRRRVEELQRQNNQYRHYAVEYQRLAERNHQLEQQMMMLCREIQQQQQQEQAIEGSHNRDHSISNNKFENFKTTESEQFDSGMRGEDRRYPWGEVRQINSVEPFDQVHLSPDHDGLLQQENQILRDENIRIKEVIERSVKEAINNLTQQFNQYFTVLTQQQQQSQQQAPNKNNSRPSSPRERQPSTDHKSDSLRISQSGGYSFDLKPVEEEEDSSSEHLPVIREKNDSIIRIDLSERSSSDRPQNSSDSSERPSFPVTPRSQFFDGMVLAESEPGSSLSQRQGQTIFTLLRQLRQLLDQIVSRQGVGVFGRRELSRSIEKQLKDIIICFFFKDNEGLLGHKQDLLSESIQMRNKIQDLNMEIGQLKHELRLRVDQSMPVPQQSSSRKASALYLEGSYYCPVSGEREEFQATKRKLLYVIEVMRGFNQDYQQLLSHPSSRREGLLSGR